MFELVLNGLNRFKAVVTGNNRFLQCLNWFEQVLNRLQLGTTGCCNVCTGLNRFISV